jgi:hypothetical protein
MRSGIVGNYDAVDAGDHLRTARSQRKAGSGVGHPVGNPAARRSAFCRAQSERRTAARSPTRRCHPDRVDEHQRRLWARMAESVDGYRAAGMDLRKLVQDLRGLIINRYAPRAAHPAVRGASTGRSRRALL